MPVDWGKVDLMHRYKVSPDSIAEYINSASKPADYGTVQITENGKVIETITSPAQAASSPYRFVDGVLVDVRDVAKAREALRQRENEREEYSRLFYTELYRLRAERHAKHVKQVRYALLPLAVVAFPIINTLRYFAGMDDLEWWYA